MEHTIKLTDEQLGIVGAALAELPFKVAQPLMAAIQAQIVDVSAKQPAGSQKSDTRQKATARNQGNATPAS
jgi:hypothetical protein